MSHAAQRQPISTSRIEVAVTALFVWITVEDEARKLLGAPLAIYGVKYVLVALAVAMSWPGTSARWVQRTAPAALRTLLIWGLMLYALGSTHPELRSMLVPLNGIVTTFFALPLLFVGARFAERPQRVEALLRLIFTLAVLVAFTGLMQAFVDPTFLNPPLDDTPSEWLVNLLRGEVPYVVGPFLSPSRYWTFLMTGAAAGTALYLLGLSGRARMFLLPGGLMIASALLSSGARTGPFVMVLLLLFTTALVQQRAQGRSLAGLRRRRRVVLLIVIGAIALSILLLVSERMTTTMTFYWESLFAEGGAGLRSRVEVNTGMFDFDLQTWLFGHGTGSVSYGRQYVMADEYEMGVEGGYSVAVWEHGALGLVFYLALSTLLCRIFVTSPVDHGPELEALAPAFGALLIVELFFLNLTGPILQQYVVAVPLWFFTGLVWGLRCQPPRRPGHA